MIWLAMQEKGMWFDLENLENNTGYEPGEETSGGVWVVGQDQTQAAFRICVWPSHPT